jgi:hypothetical protein
MLSGNEGEIAAIIRTLAKSSALQAVLGASIDPSGVSARYPVYGAPRGSGRRYYLSNNNGLTKLDVDQFIGRKGKE